MIFTITAVLTGDLNSATVTEPLLTYGAYGPLKHFAIFPDGKKYLFANNTTAHIVDASSDSIIVSTPKQRSEIVSVAASPDGSKVLTGLVTREITLWDANTGKTIRNFSGHSQQVSSMAFSSDGKRVLTVSMDGKAKLWDIARDSAIVTFSDNVSNRYIESGALSPDGSKLLTSFLAGGLALWDVAADSILMEIDFHAGTDILNKTPVAFSPNGTMALYGYMLCDLTEGTIVRSFEIPGDKVVSSAFSHDGTKALTARDSTAKIWDVATGDLLMTSPKSSVLITSAAYLPDSSKVMICYKDNTINIWDLASGTIIKAYSGHAAQVYAVAFSPDGSMVLTGSGDESAKLWDASTGAFIKTLTFPNKFTDGVSSVAFSPDGSKMLIGSWDRAVKIWDTPDFDSTIQTPPLYTGVFSLDGDKYIHGTTSGAAILRQISSPDYLVTYSDDVAISAVAISPDGKTVLTNGNNNAVYLWDVPSSGAAKRIRIFSGHSRTIKDVVFSPDGSKALSGAGDGAILWDISTGRSLRGIGSTATNSVAFSPDGSMYLTSSANTANLGNTSTGAFLLSFSDHTEAVNAVAFSPDGLKVVTGSSDGTAKLWAIDNITGSVSPKESKPQQGYTPVFSTDNRLVIFSGPSAPLKNTRLVICNAAGRMVAATKSKTPEFSARHKFSLPDHLVNGVYLYRFENNGVVLKAGAFVIGR